MDKFRKAIDTMNSLGKGGQPFLFIVNYDVSDIDVYNLNQIPGNIWYSCAGYSNTPKKDYGHKPLKFQADTIGITHYQKAFQQVQQQLALGNTYLLNLTFQTPIQTNFTLNELYLNARSPYKLKYYNQFVTFSPEKFIEIENNTIATYPMKGTIEANIPGARLKILNNNKETAEHATIVDLLRNDLSKVASNVQVEKYRYLDKIKTNCKEILQVSSKITGLLPNSWQSNIGNILYNMLPAGSVTGAPKHKTIEIIKNVENYQRGFYTGVFGVFNGNSLYSAVMIRFIENIGGDLYYKSGGGITAMSNLNDEYNELNQKIYVPVG